MFHRIVATLGVAFLGFSCIVQADTSASAELGLDTFNVTDSHSCAGTCTAQVSKSIFPPTFTYFTSGDAIAEAGFGTLRAFAATTALGVHNSRIHTGAKIAASFTDFFRVNGGALNGTLATLTIPLRFNWSFTATSAASGVGILGIAEFSVLLDPNLGISNVQSLAFREEFAPGASLGGTGQLTTGLSTFTPVPFTNTPTMMIGIELGRTIKVKADLNVTIAGNDFNVLSPANVAPFADFLVQLDAGHSAYWGGIQSVVDANGQSVEFSVSSASGHDWSQSSVPATVPLPASLVLLMAACGTLPVFTGRWSLRRGD